MTLRERLLEHKQMEDYDFAKKIYANLCNLVWYDYVNDEAISHSWRGAGGFVASIRNESFDLREGYMDFYCSGEEGEVDEEVEKLFESWNIVNLKGYYDDKNKGKSDEERLNVFKKTHPVIVSWNRDIKINNII
jgi:hypothetical protein